MTGSGRSGGERQSSSVENVDGDGEALADRAEHVVRWDFQVLVCQRCLRRSANAELSESAGDVKAFHVRPNEECRRTLDLLAGSFRLRLREGRDDAGTVPVADPLFLAVENPV